MVVVTGWIRPHDTYSTHVHHIIRYTLYYINIIYNVIIADYILSVFTH